MAIKIGGTTVIDDTRVGSLVGLEVTGTGAIKLPVGTTAQQPSPAAGQLRFNSETVSFEGYNGTAWGAIGGAGADEFAQTIALLAL